MDILGYTITKIDIAAMFLLLGLAFLCWKYKKNWMKAIILRMVISAENNHDGRDMGKQKLKEVKDKFRGWLYTKSFILGLVCEALITDKDIEKIVDKCLDEAREELNELYSSKDKIVKLALDEVQKELTLSPAIQNKEIKPILENVNKRIQAENGYISAYARYSEKEKAHVGVEFGYKF